MLCFSLTAGCVFALGAVLLLLLLFLLLLCDCAFPDEEDGGRLRETGDSRLREGGLPLQEELLQDAAGI